MLQSIEIKKTAHYYISNPKGEVKAVLFVLHGYAQTADDFIKQFELLSEEGVLIVAPEALSAFYNKQRQAVHSWMTSRHRLDEIKDYTNYLCDLENQVLSEFPVKSSILGFSQGTSTAMRWLKSTNRKHEILFVCSGSIPPELTAIDFASKTVQLNFYYGDNDGLFPPDTVGRNIEKLKSLELEHFIYPFKGRHEVSKECIEDIRLWIRA